MKADNYVISFIGVPRNEFKVLIVHITHGFIRLYAFELQRIHRDLTIRRANKLHNTFTSAAPSADYLYLHPRLLVTTAAAAM